ncbi:HEAT repeat domain-containing protein [Variovorax sp. MHTC-1]|uniref:HEAT repeat domain-containing protein n=1 Tax=Variovorax sp. MHTC-1 TaxID=2495593 RepID=UPI000F88339C|nr:hypothetical protein [Variovorax sp. MHTC-1]RST51758.1 hypothetical protein EJI01_17660 [Variovorax sp. MHTC-1]
MKWWKTRVEAVPDADCSMLELDALMELARSFNGYQREAAVVELARRADPRAIAPLLVCTGDWVQQVSDAARQGLAVFMRDEFIEHWAHALPAIAYVYRVRRIDLRETTDAIEAFLARNVDALERHARSPDNAMRRWMFSLRLKQSHDESELLGILQRGVRSNDLPTAQLGLEAASRLQEPSHRRELLVAACRSRLPRVRTTAMRELLAAADFDVRSLVRAMCMDRSAAVRSLAVGALPGERDELARHAKAILAQQASDDRLRVAALHVLFLLDDPQALLLARPLMASPTVPLRRLARWLVLCAADNGRVEMELMEILADESPKVRRLAVEHVRRGAPLPSPDALMRLGLARRELAIDVIAMLRSGSPWDRLLFVLELLHGEAPAGGLADAITNELHVWIRAMANCYVQPRAAQSARLAALWNQKARLLPNGRPKGLLPYGFPELTDYHLRAFHVI